MDEQTIIQAIDHRVDIRANEILNRLLELQEKQIQSRLDQMDMKLKRAEDTLHAMDLLMHDVRQKMP